MVVYRLLGQGAVNAFARSFGVSYALNQATEWQDIAKEALKAVFVMLILERLFISSPVGWIEGAAARVLVRGLNSHATHLPPTDHIDYLSVQAVMLREKLGLAGRIQRHVKFTQRSACPVRVALCCAMTDLCSPLQWRSRAK